MVLPTYNDEHICTFTDLNVTIRETNLFIEKRSACKSQLPEWYLSVKTKNKTSVKCAQMYEQYAVYIRTYSHFIS